MVMDFSPGYFQVSGNPAGGSTSRVSRYASARKSQDYCYQVLRRFSFPLRVTSELLSVLSLAVFAASQETNQPT